MVSRFMKKRIFFTLFFSLLLFGGFFRVSILEYLGGWAFPWIARMYDTSLSYRSIEYNNGVFLLKDVSLLDLSVDTSFSYRMEAHQMALSLNISRGKIFKNIWVDELHTTFLKKDRQTKTKESIPALHLGRLEIEKGKIELIDLADPNWYKQSLIFSVHKEEQQSALFAKVHFEDGGSLRIDWIEEDLKKQFNWHFDHVSGPNLLSVAQFFHAKKALEIEELTGIIQGNFSTSFETGQMKKFWVDFSWLEPKVLSSNYQLYADRLDLRSEYEDLPQKDKSSLAQILSPKVLENVSLSAELQNGFFSSTSYSHSLQNVSGIVSLSKGLGPRWDLRGTCLFAEMPRQVHWLGKGYLFSHQKSWIDSELTLNRPDASAVVIQARCNDLDFYTFELFTHIEKFTDAEYAFFQPFMPFLQNATLQKGMVEGDVVLQCRGSQVEKLQLYQVSGENIVASYEDLATKVTADQVKGSLEVDFTTEDIRDLFCTYFHCKNANVQSVNNIDIEQINAEIVIEKGHILPSYLSAISHGVEGRVTLLGSLQEIKSAFEIQGSLYTIANLYLPENVKVPEENAKAMLYYTHRDDYCDFSGELCSLEDERSYEKVSFDLQCQKDQWNFGGETRPSLCNAIVDGSVIFKKVNLESYKPFLRFLPIENWEGQVSGKALLRPGNWFFSLTGNHLALQTQTFHAALPEITSENPWLGSFNPIDFTIDSSLSLQKATCYLPRFDLTFENIQAETSYTDHHVFIDIADTVSENVHFQGKVSLNLLDLDCVSLEVATDKIQGDLNSADRFLHHFSIQLFDEYPLKANFESGEKGFHLATVFSDEYPGVYWGIDARISEGCYALNKGLALENIEGDIHWSSLEADFLLRSARGDLVFSGSECPTAYSISIPHLEKTLDDWHFDVRVGNTIWDCLRLTGKVMVYQGDELLVDLDTDKSHFFSSHFSASELTYSPNKGCKVSVEGTTDMKVLPQQLTFLQDFQILSFLPDPLKKTMQGSLSVSMDIDTASESSLSLSAKNVAIGEQNIGTLKVSAKTQQDVWNIEEFSIDQLTGSLTLEKGNELWQLKQLQASYQDLFDVQMTGTLNNELFLDANVEKLHVNLSGAKDAWGTNTFFSEKVEGSIVGQGHLIVHLSTFDVDTKLQFEAPAFTVHNLNLVNASPVTVSYSESSGVQIQGLDFHFQEPDLPIEPFRFQLEKLSFEPESEQWQLTKLHLSLPKDSPQKIGSFFEIDFLQKKVQLQKGMQLEMDGFYSPSQNSWELSLKEANIPLANRWVELQDISLRLDPAIFSVDLLFLEEERVSRLQTSIDLQKEVRGQSRLTELNSDPEEQKPLEVIWQYSTEHGIALKSIQGSYCGLSPSLYAANDRSTEDTMCFTGSLGIDFRQCRHLLDGDFQEMVDALQMGYGYEFKGTILVGRQEGFPMSWQGIFSGKSCALLGCEFKTLLAHINLQENSLVLSGLKISDTAGILKIDDLLLETRSAEDVFLKIPKFSLTEFRPSLLKRQGKAPEEIQPLVVRSFEILDFEGNLNDLQSFKGYGTLSFINSFKRGYTLFDVPSDLLGRIFGVDQELLVPVQGEIDFDVKEGKFVLTALKDSFSLNKRSEFFFDPSWPRPTVSLDGNLEIYVKMKHYVLFKFTENFVLSIQGSLKDPKYALRRKIKDAGS